MLKYLAALTAVATVQQAIALPQPQTAPITQCATDTYLVGDGDPHQNTYEIQVTAPLDCGDGGSGCSVSRLTSHTIGYSVSVGVSAGPWISAGFSVEQSVTTGETYTCEAKPNQRVCVWGRVPHTAYTVYKSVHGNDCGAEANDGEPYVLKSPNSGENAISYYCVHDDACRGNGDGYWNNDG